MMRITLVDQYPDKGLPRLAEVARALQTQISEDFAPIWGADAVLRVVRLPRGVTEPRLSPSDGIVYLAHVGESPVDGLSASVDYHRTYQAGIPCGFVFPDLVKKPWSVLLSQEILQMLVDPDLNLYVAGPHPDPNQVKKPVLRPYEICDPVQASHYVIHDVEVANFVTPQYFARTPRRPTGPESTHYLRTPSLEPFGVLGGGHYSYYDVDGRVWRDYWETSAGAANHQNVTSALARGESGDAPRLFRRLKFGTMALSATQDNSLTVPASALNVAVGVDVNGPLGGWPIGGENGANGPIGPNGWPIGGKGGGHGH
jgi:hypothetical protein